MNYHLAQGKAGAFVPEIEVGLLGAILAGGDHRAALAILDPDDFIEPVHCEVFKAIRNAQDQYGTTAMPTVVKLIPAKVAGEFEAATGITLNAYLASAVAGTLTGPGQSRVAAKGVLGQHARLAIGREAALVATAADDPAADPVQLARGLAERLDDVTGRLRRGGRGKTRSMAAEAADMALAAAREARERQGLVGITTGLIDLDRAMGGLHRSDLIVMAARPAMGKTTLATSISRAAAASGVGVALFSLEMDRVKLGARYASDIAHAAGISIPYRDIINGSITADDEHSVADALAEYRSLPFVIEDQSGVTASDIRTKTEIMAAEAEQRGAPLGLVVVDHLGKIRPSSRYAGNRANEVGEVTDALKEMARELNVAVLLLSQLNRGVEGRDDKRPVLMDLRDSGNIEQDADAVLFLYREAYYLEQRRPENFDKVIDWQADLAAVAHKAELSIAKQRNGPTPTIDLYMDVACSAVRNAAKLGAHHG